MRNYGSLSRWTIGAGAALMSADYWFGPFASGEGAGVVFLMGSFFVVVGLLMVPDVLAKP